MMHLSTHQDISLGLKIVHVHHLEKHLMGQFVYTFLGKKEHQLLFVTIESDFVFCSIVTTNIQKTLQPINTGDEHTYKYNDIMIFYGGLMVHITDTRTQKVVSYTAAHITETVLAHDQHWEEHSSLSSPQL